MVDYRLVERFVASGTVPRVCSYLRGYYCLLDTPVCSARVVSGDLYQCDGSIFKSVLHRMQNDRRKLVREAESHRGEDLKLWY